MVVWKSSLYDGQMKFTLYQLKNRFAMLVIMSVL